MEEEDFLFLIRKLNCPSNNVEFANAVKSCVILRTTQITLLQRFFLTCAKGLCEVLVFNVYRRGMTEGDDNTSHDPFGSGALKKRPLLDIASQ